MKEDAIIILTVIWVVSGLFVCLIKAFIAPKVNWVRGISALIGIIGLVIAPDMYKEIITKEVEIRCIEGDFKYKKVYVTDTDEDSNLTKVIDSIYIIKLKRK